MVAAASIGVSMKTLFIFLFCVMVAAFAYLFLFGDYFSCFDIHSRWFILMAVDFTACTVPIVAWVYYKESSWIFAFIVMAAMNVLGRDANGGSFVVVARVIFSVLGCLVLGALIYTLVDELSPFYTKEFASCFITFETDIYIHIAMFSVWIAYKESSWTSAFFWIASLVCLRGVALCAYILRRLFDLSPQQPASLIIFNNTGR
ncbi:uncharacterized protein LOC110942911 [Helianthus annuus]|uniref:uncharacterized protein LOC110942911 n=1 Tax=Helianthus annuus TaxID=4232 RepID=UPI00165318E8|nr:uncharacterized protein LOC110942911 [Helianthus annuus]